MFFYVLCHASRNKTDFRRLSRLSSFKRVGRQRKEQTWQKCYNSYATDLRATSSQTVDGQIDVFWERERKREREKRLTTPRPDYFPVRYISGPPDASGHYLTGKTCSSRMERQIVLSFLITRVVIQAHNGLLNDNPLPASNELNELCTVYSIAMRMKTCEVRSNMLSGHQNE